MVGHSGVGKSTLVNRLVPDADRAVGVVSAIGKGRHTSTSAVALRLPGRERPAGSSTRPGVRSLRAGPRRRPTACCTASPTWSRRTVDCPPNCDHTGAAGDCGLDALVAAGGADPRRLASYRRLLASRVG